MLEDSKSTNCRLSKLNISRKFVSLKISDYQLLIFCYFPISQFCFRTSKFILFKLSNQVSNDLCLAKTRLSQVSNFICRLSTHCLQQALRPDRVRSIDTGSNHVKCGSNVEISFNKNFLTVKELHRPVSTKGILATTYWTTLKTSAIYFPQHTMTGRHCDNNIEPMDFVKL